MLTLTDRVRRAERSSIRHMFDLAERYEGDLVRLEVGEPDFDTPEHVIDAAFQAARDGETHYTSNAGLPACRRAISETLSREFSVEHDPDEIVVTVGGMEALHLAVVATVSPGEELLVPGPTWPNYETQALLADGSLREIEMPAETGFDLDADHVIEAMSNDTAAVVLTTPSNPTGRVYDPVECRAVVEAAAEHDAYVIADEVYLGLTYDGAAEGIAAHTGHPEHVLTVGSCSKAYAMTGWRLGWLAGDARVIDEVVKVRESTTACASSIAQHAAIAALTGPQEPFEEMYRAFRKRRDLVVDRVDEIEGLSCPRPEGAFYAYLDPGLDDDGRAVAEYLLTEHGVVLAPGDGFGDTTPGRLRLSFANSTERLHEGFDRIDAGLSEYR
jgi:aspartate aminotransferase